MLRPQFLGWQGTPQKSSAALVYQIRFFLFWPHADVYFIFQFYNSIFLYFIVCKKKFFEKLGSSTFPDKKKLIRPEIPQYVFLHWLCEIVSIPLLHKLVPLLHKLATFSHWFLFPVLIYNSDHFYSISYT